MNAQLLDEIFAMIIEKIVYSQTLKTKRHDDSDGSEDHFKDPPVSSKRPLELHSISTAFNTEVKLFRGIPIELQYSSYDPIASSPTRMLVHTKKAYQRRFKTHCGIPIIVCLY